MRLPEALIVGAQKSGTTTLHACLSAHPRIHGPIAPMDSSPRKELHFFSNHWDKGVDWYRSHFEFTDGIGLESTPNYLCDPDAQERLCSVIPDAKLIVSLREPVARAFSHFNHYTQALEKTKHWKHDFPRPGESFSANVEAGVNEIGRPWYGIVNRGYYDEQLSHLLKFFPREQVHVVIMERWIEHPDECLDGILNFLGVDHVELPKKAAHMRAYTVDPLSADTAAFLKDLYRPHNERLFDLLGDSIPEWCAA